MLISPSRSPDALVIGLGAMGSATALHLAKRGVKVTGIDQFTPPHHHGSTHGESRITREAVGEGAAFVPLARRSHVLWRELEATTGASLLTQCGGLIVAREGRVNVMHDQSDFLGNTLKLARQFGIEHSTLNATDIAACFPQLNLTGDEAGYYEPGAGFLRPENCVATNLTEAKRNGATLCYNETVRAIHREGAQTIVETDYARYAPGTTIVCAGPWLNSLVPALKNKTVVRRQVMYWFALDGSHDYTPEKFPVFIWPWGSGENDVFYGFPQIDQAGRVACIKVATEQNEFATNASSVDRQVTQHEIESMYQHLGGRLRGVTTQCVQSTTCLYTNLPGAHFLIDRLPDAHELFIVSACSGHGFKHSAAIGEAVAEMTTSGKTPAVLAPFAWNKN